MKVTSSLIIAWVPIKISIFPSFNDVLYMSATPIPRTYALTIYGDMDTSIIKAKPNGRKAFSFAFILPCKTSIRYLLLKASKNFSLNFTTSFNFVLPSSSRIKGARWLLY